MAGEHRCHGAALERCENSAWQRFVDCETPALCRIAPDFMGGECLPSQCSSGAHACDGPRLLRCSEGRAGTDFVARRAVRLMRERHPRLDVTEAASLVDCGRVVTGGGVTLGIDATLHLLARLLGDDVANETARIMDYTRAWRANREALPVIVQ